MTHTVQCETDTTAPAPSAVLTKASGPARTRKPSPTVNRAAPAASKSDLVVKKLKTAKGASVQQLAELTGWQVHSVRGFLSAVVRKKLSLNLMSEVGKDEVRRYRVIDNVEEASA